MLITISIDIDAMLIYWLIIVVIVLIFYAIVDIPYFLTMGLIIIWCNLRRKRIKIDETTEYYGICTTNDLDVYMRHMNNARFIRELDFAKLHFCQRTGILKTLLPIKDGAVLQTASHIRYRRTIKIFSSYKITTRIVYWDDNNLYLEQQFIKLEDGFVATVILSKQTVVGMNVVNLINKLGKDHREPYQPKKPEISPEIETFIQLNEKSSEKLRNSD